MRINGKNYKSINFTVLKDKLLKCQKKQTFRTIYIPTFDVGETVAITFRDIKGGKKEFLYFVKITEIFPKKIKELDLKDARLDGFDSVREFQDTVMKLNKITNTDHYGFIIRWRLVKDPQSRLLIENLITNEV